MIELQYDQPLDIALGKWRKSEHWKNETWDWSRIVNKISKTWITAETHAEYMNFAKSKQDEVKDIGGFVGGMLLNGKRTGGSAVHRQLICLDADHLPKGGFWDNFTMLYGCAAALYSTHKHTPDNPRLRLIIPLDREVMRDQYEAIARRIAGNLGINNFDDTTFQAERLMYWPSTSKDAEYIFEYNDGDFLNADEVLASYRDWKDVTEWPVSDRVDVAVLKGISKQEDPTEKKGLIGAWCRTYTISEAIEKFLDKIYEPCDNADDRYTYLDGSTAGGLVVYDDKFTYSHHGTDPTSNKLCNAFDLVRIHLFGDKDKKTNEGHAYNKLPSYLSMLDFVGSDKETMTLHGKEKMAEVRDVFGVIDYPDAEIADDEPAKETEAEDLDWLSLLDADRKGNYFSTIDNMVVILKNDAVVKGCFAYNEFDKREVALKRLPWRSIKGGKHNLTDNDENNIFWFFEKKYGITGDKKINAAMNIVMYQNAFHPVLKYLNGLEWDGTHRLDTLYIDYLGAEDSPYTRSVTRKAFVAGVARILRPGVKFDHCLTTVGKEGTGKSMIPDKMGGEWFSDSFTTVHGKEAYEQLQGSWLIEIAELSGFKKSEAETVKHFISKRKDKYRVAYGKRIEDFLRQCVFFGTANKIDFLMGINGDRKFWPVLTHVTQPVKSVRDDLTQKMVDQLWAEALHFYNEGEKLYLSDELEAVARKVQSEHAEKDDRTGMIREFLSKPVPEDWDEMDIYQRREFHQNLAFKSDKADELKDRTVICVAEICCEVLGWQIKDLTAANTKPIHAILSNFKDWDRAKSSRTFAIYGEQRAYVRPDVWYLHKIRNEKDEKNIWD